jgi:hypothetical protein
MADAAQVVVGSGGSIHIAPAGTALPTTVGGALNAAFTDLGYISEDGITASFGVSVEDVNAFQSLLPIRRVVTGRTAEMSFTLRQWNADTFAFALGGGTFDSDEAGNYTFFPPANDDALGEKTVVIEWSDGSKDYRLCIERAVVVENVETNIVRNAAADLPITLSVLGSESTDAWYLVTNDTAFDTTA